MSRIIVGLNRDHNVIAVGTKKDEVDLPNVIAIGETGSGLITNPVKVIIATDYQFFRVTGAKVSVTTKGNFEIKGTIKDGRMAIYGKIILTGFEACWFQRTQIFWDD